MTAGRTSPEIDSVPAARTISDWAPPAVQSPGTAAATTFGRVWGELTATRRLDRDTLRAALSRIDRTERPAFLFDVASNLRPHSGVLASVILAVWSETVHPGDSVDREGWVWLFARAGVTRHGGQLAFDGGADDGGYLMDRPAEPLRLYRGAVPARRHGMSWTGDRSTAAMFATAGRPGGSLWSAEVEPWRLLAHCPRRGEDEYVVDTRGLKVLVHN